MLLDPPKGDHPLDNMTHHLFCHQFRSSEAKSIICYDLSGGGIHDGVLVSVLDSVLSSPGWSPGWGHCVVFLHEILYSLKVKDDHRSKFSNLSNWKEEAWKNQGFNRIWTCDLREYRCDALPTELWKKKKIYCDDHPSLSSTTTVHIWIISYKLHIISFLTGRYELNKVTSLPMCGFIAQLVEHRTGIRGGHGFESRWSPDFFRLLLSNCLHWKINCDDRSSLSVIILKLKTRPEQLNIYKLKQTNVAVHHEQ